MISLWDLAQVVSGWGGFVGDSRLKSQWGQKKLQKKKGWKIMINACELFVVQYFEVLHTLNCLVILYG